MIRLKPLGWPAARQQIPRFLRGILVTFVSGRYKTKATGNSRDRSTNSIGLPARFRIMEIPINGVVYPLGRHLTLSSGGLVNIKLPGKTPGADGLSSLSHIGGIGLQLTLAQMGRLPLEQWWHFRRPAKPIPGWLVSRASHLKHCRLGRSRAYRWEDPGEPP